MLKFKIDVIMNVSGHTITHDSFASVIFFVIWDKDNSRQGEKMSATVCQCMVKIVKLRQGKINTEYFKDEHFTVQKCVILH